MSTAPQIVAAGPVIPTDPQRAGPHWVQAPWRAVVVRHWYPEAGTWSDGLGDAHGPDGWTYLGPCLTPAEVLDIETDRFCLSGLVEAAGHEIRALRQALGLHPTIRLSLPTETQR